MRRSLNLLSVIFKVCNEDTFFIFSGIDLNSFLERSKNKRLLLSVKISKKIDVTFLILLPCKSNFFRYCNISTLCVLDIFNEVRLFRERSSQSVCSGSELGRSVRPAWEQSATNAFSCRFEQHRHFVTQESGNIPKKRLRMK